MEIGDLVIYEALHYVGDDPIKSQIEKEIYDTFKHHPIMLAIINEIFRKAMDKAKKDEEEMIKCIWKK